MVCLGLELGFDDSVSSGEIQGVSRHQGEIFMSKGMVWKSLGRPRWHQIRGQT